MVKNFIVFIVCFFSSFLVSAQKESFYSLESVFENPSDDAKPWVLWYWMYAAVSKEGITADLEALQKAGIRGAYLVCIYDTTSKVPFQTPARQLTPRWWSMVNHAMKESKRLGMKLAFHVSDGFALAGGPWIKPEQSMQKVVWTKTFIKGKKNQNIQLIQPETNENYYSDIAVFAYPANSVNAFTGMQPVPKVTTSTGEDASFLYSPQDESGTFRSDSTCWIQYKYNQPFTLRSLKTRSAGNNFQSRRLIVQSSNDGKNFHTVLSLQPPRHGWQDTDEDYTFSIPETTATYFRFVYDKEGTEAGSEDLDAAKWKPSLKIKGIYLSDEPVINQIEAKNGSVWRVAQNTTEQMVADKDAVKLSDIVNLTNKMDKDGNLNWQPPKGNWVIVRIGHTSTGHKNSTGGAAKGLECDKFDPEAIQLQFNSWFGKAFERTDPGLAREVLKIFYIDSWEAGSQNWSKTFADEFKKRRGYDLLPYLLVMTGVPVENAVTSEKVLHDVRETIAELVNDIFYVTLRKLADEKGCTFTAESVAPTMVSDGLLHYKTVDYPTGEFWLNSPTHDKPNDMLDAINAAHIYGKNIVQAEAFTTLRMDWSEHPGNLKVVGDRNLAMGINRIVFHVNTLNPWLDRKPGMTLNSIGLFFQRDQTWFKQGKAWVDYLTRASSLLQQGRPVADIAVFIGEEVPRRSILPERLVGTLPGIFGEERVEAEKLRLENKGQPQRTIPYGVTHSANMADPEDWTDALRGYKFSSFNPDALLQTTVENGKVVMPSGNAYPIVVFPGERLMNPNSGLMSLPVAKKILELKEAGATIIIDTTNKQAIGLKDDDLALQVIWEKIINDKSGKIYSTPFLQETFDMLGVPRDVDVTKNNGRIAWTHRRSNDEDIYFISNQENSKQFLDLSFRVSGRIPEIWDAVTGGYYPATQWKMENNRTYLKLPLEANASAFIIFRKRTDLRISDLPQRMTRIVAEFEKDWRVKFDTAFGGPQEDLTLDKLIPWNRSKNDSIKYYSGTAIYKNHFSLKKIATHAPVYLVFDSIFNIASVSINGTDCGTVWTPPYRLDISKAVKTGDNHIEITVSNTWFNRLSRDHELPESKRITWTIAPLSFTEGRPLLKAGLVGKVRIEQ